MYQPCLQFPDLVGQRDLHNGKVQWSVATHSLYASQRLLTICIRSVLVHFLLLHLEHGIFLGSPNKKLQVTKKNVFFYAQTHGSPVPRWLSEQTGEQHSCEYVGPTKKLTKHSKSTGWNEHSCETHSLAFYDSDLESVSLDHTWLEHAELAKSIKKRWPRACKLLRGHCAHSVLNFLLDTPQIRRSWTCLERCSCFSRYFGRTLDYHRRSKDFKSWNEAFILLRKTMG